MLTLLRGLPGLRRMVLSDCDWGDDFVSGLTTADTAQLNALGMVGCNLTDTGAAHLLGIDLPDALDLTSNGLSEEMVHQIQATHPNAACDHQHPAGSFDLPMMEGIPPL